MSKVTFSPGFEDKVQAVMAVPDARPEFISGLRSRLIEEAAQTPVHKPAFKVRMAWAVPTLIVLALLITTLVIGPQKVWAAIQKWFGYLPGVGYVTTDRPILVLPEPVEMEREGITVTVVQVVADSERTTLRYEVSGYSTKGVNPQDVPTTFQMEQLRLEDGREIDAISGSSSGFWAGQSSQKIFPALPEGISKVSLVIPRLRDMPAGWAPEDWEIQLELEPDTGELEVLPVQEISPGTTGASDLEVASSGDISAIFELARVVELKDGFRFEGTLECFIEGDEICRGLARRIQVTDAEGMQVPTKYADPDPFFESQTKTEVQWAVRTTTKSQPGPWTISLLEIDVYFFPEINFSIDLGEDPQVGQEWQVDLPIKYGEFEFSLTSVILEEGLGQTYRLTLYFTLGENIWAIYIHNPHWDDYGSNPLGAAMFADGGNWQNGEWAALDYNSMPDGLHQFTIGIFSVIYKGDWQLTWQPPERASQHADPERLSACIDVQEWQDVEEGVKPELPEEIVGDLLLQMNSGERLPIIALVGLDTDLQQEYSPGEWISLSPDGKKIAVPSEDKIGVPRDEGITLIDTNSGASRLLPGTSSGPPIWSPDSQEILFHNWYEDTLYRMNLDDSELIELYQGEDLICPAAWMPDDKIIYGVTVDESLVVKAISITGGESEVFLQTDYKIIFCPHFSPNGEWMIFYGASGWDSELEDYIDHGIYLSRIDGSETRLLATEFQGNQVSFDFGAWSPDGEWVALNAWENRLSESKIIPVLVSVETCELVPLPWLNGKVAGWRE